MRGAFLFRSKIRSIRGIRMHWYRSLLELDDLDGDLAARNREPCDARLKSESPLARRTGVHDPASISVHDELFVGVPVHDHVGAVRREELRRCRRPDFMAVT